MLVVGRGAAPHAAARVAVVSEKEKGSTFTVELPLVHDPLSPNKQMSVKVTKAVEVPDLLSATTPPALH